LEVESHRILSSAATVVQNFKRRFASSRFRLQAGWKIQHLVLSEEPLIRERDIARTAWSSSPSLTLPKRILILLRVDFNSGRTKELVALRILVSPLLTEVGLLLDGYLHSPSPAPHLY
jgi:hypothetical protein